MAVIEPVVEFGKNADSAASTNPYDISWKFVGDSTTGGTGTLTIAGDPDSPLSVDAGEQSQNWVNKNSQVVAESETDLWNKTILSIFNDSPGQPDYIDSGVGFVDALASVKDIIRGNVSREETIRIYCNRNALWTKGGDTVAAAENCRLKVYDRPEDSPTWPPTEPQLTAVSGGDGGALFWTAVEQKEYFYYAAGWNAKGESGAPALLGYNAGAPIAHSLDEEPHASIGAGYQGVNEYPIGDTLAGSRFLGIRESEAAGGGYLDAEGGYVELGLQLFVNENAAAKFNSWGLGVEYTFVLD